MNAKKLLEKFNARLAKESWIRAALCGLTVGFSLNILCSVVFLFVGVRMFWISILAFLVGTGIATPIFYFAKFKNDFKDVSARVDALGLEERILTMAQFENDDSFMARRQREDAMSALKTVNESLIKIAISVPLVFACIATFVVGVGATTASAISPKSIMEVIRESQENNPDDPVFFSVEYDVLNGEGGMIEGDIFQLIESGKNGAPVQAIPDDDYVFAGWTDGYDSDFRIDSDVSEDLHLYAIFLPIEDGDEEDENENDGDGNEPGDPSNQPSDQPPQPGDPGDGGDGGGEGGQSNPNNMFTDGSTFYGSCYGQSLGDAQAAMGNGDFSSSESGTIGDFFGNIAK